MEKKSEFMWQWGNYAPLPDKLMTRKRAATLLMAWRRSARKPANSKNVVSVERIKPGHYRATSYYDESGTLIIG